MKTNYSKKENLILQVHKKFIDCMVNNEIITIHLHSNNVVMRVSIIPEEINIDGDTLSIECRSYCLNIDNIDYIEHIEEEYDTYYVKSGDIKIYFDFV